MKKLIEYGKSFQVSVFGVRQMSTVYSQFEKNYGLQRVRSNLNCTGRRTYAKPIEATVKGAHGRTASRIASTQVLLNFRCTAYYVQFSTTAQDTKFL